MVPRHYFLKLKENNVEFDEPENFVKDLNGFGAKLDAKLVEQLADEFTRDVMVKNKPVPLLPLLEVSDYYLARHPTAPPPPPKAKKKGKKSKKGADDKTKR